MRSVKPVWQGDRGEVAGEHTVPTQRSHAGKLHVSKAYVCCIQLPLLATTMSRYGFIRGLL